MTKRTRIALAIAALLGFAWGPVLGLPADAAPRTCQYDAYSDAYGNYITVWARPDQDVAVRVNGRTIRRHTPHERVPGDVLVIFRTHGSYTPDDVRAYVNGHRCGWGVGLPAAPAAPASSSAPAAPSWSEGLPPCAYEDGSGGPVPCYWDAGNAGNGRGRSYIIRADGTTDYAAAGPAGEPFCQYDAYGHEIGVTGYGFRPGVKVAARVNGRTLRGKLDSDSAYTWHTRGVYTQTNVVVRVNGRVCEGT